MLIIFLFIYINEDIQLVTSQAAAVSSQDVKLPAVAEASDISSLAISDTTKETKKESFTHEIKIKWLDLFRVKNPNAAEIESMLSRYEGIVDAKNRVRSAIGCHYCFNITLHDVTI